MERLTEKRQGQWVIPLRQDGKHQWFLCSAGMGDMPAEYLYGEYADRLAAYEDTGLEPEDIISAVDMARIACALHELNAYIGLGPIDHLRELVQAEQDGGLLKLPCKPGDTVWTNFAMAGWYFRDKDKPYTAQVVFVGLNNSEEMGGGLFNVVYAKGGRMLQFRFADIGKIVFLTRDEAEAALVTKGEHDG